MARAAVYLVPGFFGFDSLASLSYFVGVKTALARNFARLGVDADIIEVETQPTGSLRGRALRLLEVVTDTGGLDAGELHFIGHSTGGLDIRLLLSPGVKLSPGDDREERIGALARSAVSVSTPHFGTPLAGFFTTFFGRQLLFQLTSLSATRTGRTTVTAMAQALALIASLDDLVGARNTALDHFAARLLGKVTAGEEHALWAFLQRVRDDQGAIVQLTQESVDIFNAAVVDRPGIRYASVLTAAPPPAVSLRAAGMRNLYAPASRALYALIWSLTSRCHRVYTYPHPGEGALAEPSRALPFALDRRSNDGIVPTLSQMHGHVLDVVVGDHLDVVGQFDRTHEGEPYVSWLHSGSGFDDTRFDGVWRDVAGWVAGAAS